MTLARAALLLMLLACGRSEAGDVPLPPRRPPVLPPIQAPVADAACGRLLAGGQVEAAPAALVAGAGGCGIAAPVRLAAIVLRDGARVALEPPATMRCELAAALALWVREDVAPAAPGGGLAKILSADAYACRPRNGVAGAKLSEHGKGNALDIRGVVLRDGTRLLVSDKGEFTAALGAGACARFPTMLGPGSDGLHEDHIHVDLEERRGGYRICR